MNELTNEHRLAFLELVLEPTSWWILLFLLFHQEIPLWISCPPAESETAVWSTVITGGMAERASVLAMSIRVSQDNSVLSSSGSGY